VREDHDDLRGDRPKQPTILSVTPGKTDADLAAELRAMLRPLLEEVVLHLNSASQSGLQVNFQIGRDGYGRSALIALDVVRLL